MVIVAHRWYWLFLEESLFNIRTIQYALLLLTRPQPSYQHTHISDILYHPRQLGSVSVVCFTLMFPLPLAGVERRVRLVIEEHRSISLDDITPEGQVMSEAASSDTVQVTVCERDVYELHNAWETFDVTSAVKYWLSHPSVPQLLQVYVSPYPTLVSSTNGNVIMLLFFYIFDQLAHNESSKSVQRFYTTVI